MRVIAATNRNLRQLVDEGFQEDLFRLRDPPSCPASRASRTSHTGRALDKHATRSGKSIDALEEGVVSSLQEYHWPGNVRELENTIERALVLTPGSTITRDAVTVEPAMSRRAVGIPSLNIRQNVEWIERETIRRALDAATLKRQAAGRLGISPRALSYYLDKYALGDRNLARMPSTPS